MGDPQADDDARPMKNRHDQQQILTGGGYGQTEYTFYLQ